MDSNTHSTEPRARSSAEYSAGPPDSLAAFTAAAEDLAAQDLDGLTDAVRAERVLELRRLLDRWKATGFKSWPGWTPGARPAPKTTSRSALPPAGCGPGCAWAVAPPAVVSARPGR